MAPIGAKLGQNAFQTIPDISFFDAENQKMPNFEWPFTPRIWLRSASNFGKTRFRRFPTFHFSTPKKKNRFFPKLQTAVYPSNMAPIGTKLWENAFQTIPHVSFFDTTSFFKTCFFTQKPGFYKSLVLEEQRCSECHWHLPRQKLLHVVRLFSLYDPWRRGKRLPLCF